MSGEDFGENAARFLGKPVMRAAQDAMAHVAVANQEKPIAHEVVKADGPLKNDKAEDEAPIPVPEGAEDERSPEASDEAVKQRLAALKK